MQVYGAVAPLTGRTHYHISQTLGKEELTVFLRQLLRSYSDKAVVVIHDRAEQHQGAPIEALRRDVDGRLILKPQPAYSPALHKVYASRGLKLVVHAVARGLGATIRVA
jgi:hypothetical protein